MFQALRTSLVVEDHKMQDNKSSVAIMSKAVYCDCHGTEKGAVIRDGKIIILFRRNRKDHTIAINIDELYKTKVD